MEFQDFRFQNQLRFEISTKISKMLYEISRSCGSFSTCVIYWSIKEWFDLVCVAGDRTGRYCLGMNISSSMNLNNNVRHDCFLRSSSDGHFNVSSIFVILPLRFLLQGLFKTKPACCMMLYHL